MRNFVTFRLLLSVLLVFLLVRAFVTHSAHVGPIEWVVGIVLLAMLLVTVVRAPRRAV